jgi:APA family basic amino acid/polyamine antiporter
MALTFGYYASPDLARPLAVAAVIALAAVNYFGIQKTVTLTKLILALVLASLAVVVVAALLGGEADADRITPLVDDSHGPADILQAAGLLFFAFAGYARIATLGEEVANPRTTIPRAIPIALGITLLVYAGVAIASLAAIGSDGLARADAPLTAVVKAGDLSELAPVVRIGATIASLGVLLSLMVGVSRTLFSMSANGDMPRLLAHVHPRYKVPDRAELAVAACIIVVILIADVRHAIGFSSFAVLLYYAIANASALTLGRAERRSPPVIALLGAMGCAVLALSLPWESVSVGSAVVCAGVLVYVAQTGRRRVVTR